MADERGIREEQAARRTFLTELLADLRRADLPGNAHLIASVETALAEMPGEDRSDPPTSHADEGDRE